MKKYFMLMLLCSISCFADDYSQALTDVMHGKKLKRSNWISGKYISMDKSVILITIPGNSSKMIYIPMNDDRIANDWTIEK